MNKVLIGMWLIVGAINLYGTIKKRKFDAIDYWLVYIAMMTLLLEKAIG